MARTPPSPSTGRDILASPEPVGDERQRALALALVAKTELGYEVESKADFEAVIFSPSPRRWLRTRPGRENDRLVVSVNDDCQVTTRRR